ncbi:MAG: LTA synthase family protein [Defluviitaleaceae bacterium]|nr:LTA synthase family protein [Defluviitaleaceae bacterium]
MNFSPILPRDNYKRRRRGAGYDNGWHLFLGLPMSFVLLVLASLALTAGLLVVIQPNSLTQTAIVALILESNGLTFLYNWLPVLLVMLILFFATGRLVLTCGLAGFLFVIPGVMNRFMIEMRHAPLRPLDLWLGMEFFGVAHSIQPVIFIGLGLGLLGCIVVLVVSIKFIKNARPALLLRVGGSTVSIGFFVLLFVFVIGDVERYHALPMTGSYFNTTQQYQSKGFVYSFLHAIHHSRMERPVYFEEFRAQIEALEAENSAFAAPTQEQLPHVVMVLSEAFSELAMSPHINFDGLPDPMQHYREIIAEPGTISGHIVVPHIGGGTADTEFDILTGINARRFRGVPYAFTMVTRPFPGVVSVFNDAGYRALAMHPGMGWFYNRQNVYPYLGFEAFLDIAAFDAEALRGGYISEEHTIDQVLEAFRGHLDSGDNTPLFLKAITIQNHGPYDGKYGDVEMNFNIVEDMTNNPAIDLTDAASGSLAQYFYGMFDVDEGLRRLVAYFRALDEPVVLVYYSDHLPSFPLAIYEALIPEPDDAVYGEVLIRYNRVPFLIWANDAAMPLLDTEPFMESFPADQTISAHYLGAALVEMLGLSDPFLDFVNSLRGDFPVVLERTFFAPDGDMQLFDAAVHWELGLYNSWGYFRITR